MPRFSYLKTTLDPWEQVKSLSFLVVVVVAIKVYLTTKVLWAGEENFPVNRHVLMGRSADWETYIVWNDLEAAWLAVAVAVGQFRRYGWFWILLAVYGLFKLVNLFSLFWWVPEPTIFRTIAV